MTYRAIDDAERRLEQPTPAEPEAEPMPADEPATDGPRVIDVEHPEPAILDTDSEGEPAPRPADQEPVAGQLTIDSEATPEPESEPEA
jgi:hypothetical protein